MAAAVPASRIINASEKKSRSDIKKSYKEHVYKGCGKALSCQKVCPAKIEIDKTLSSTNFWANRS
jgi:succinate dehydrogenase/fumarate reductase-like Fe-S protein